MKTKIISTLKKELLIVELPEDNWITVFPKLIWICDRETNEYHHIKGSYTLLGKPNDFIGEDAKELVDRDKSVMFEYKNYNGGKRFLTATESLLSAIEREIYWGNPLANEIHAPDVKEWKQAQEKTFEKSRTLIFVKN